MDENPNFVWNNANYDMEESPRKTNQKTLEEPIFSFWKN